MTDCIPLTVAPAAGELQVDTAGVFTFTYRACGGVVSFEAATITVDIEFSHHGRGGVDTLIGS